MVSRRCFLATLHQLSTHLNLCICSPSSLHGDVQRLPWLWSWVLAGQYVGTGAFGKSIYELSMI